MGVVETLKKTVTSKRERTRKININFDDDCLTSASKIIELNKPEFKLPIQCLAANEIEALIQSKLKILEVEVEEMELETSNRLRNKFAPRNYCEPIADEKSFLDELYECDDIEIGDENRKSWSRGKVRLKIKEGSDYWVSNKEHAIADRPKGIKIRFKKAGEYLTEKSIFTLPGININQETINKLYKGIAIGGKFNGLEGYESRDYIRDNIYKVLDLDYLVGLCIVLESCYSLINKDVSFLYNPRGSYYGLEYTVEDFINLLDLSFLTKMNGFVSEKIASLICDCSMAATHMQISNALTEEYSNVVEKEYSRSYQTKKNIPDKIKAVMKNNDFLSSFKIVELDEMTDIEKFYQIENEFIKVKEALNLNRFLNGSNCELRFRRLGQHRASGLYYSGSKCICVDINSPSSFIHEIGHYIDNTVSHNGNASNNSEFRPLAMRYKRELEKTLENLEPSEENKKIGNYYKRKRGYYHTPTEIFARALEIYLVFSKNMVSSFLPDKSEFTLRNGYPKITSELTDEINNYFEELLGDIENNLDTTTSNMSHLISFEDIRTTETIDEVVEVAADNINTEDTNQNDEVITRYDSIEPAHSCEGANFIFSVIKEALTDESGNRHQLRRRTRINRRPVEEDANASQLGFFSQI